MNTTITFRLITGALLTGLANLPLLAGSPFVEELRPGDPVTIELASGRRFKVTLDEKTDESTLWVRSERASGSILRPIQWFRLVQADFGGQTISGLQLLDAVRAWPDAPSGDEELGLSDFSVASRVSRPGAGTLEGSLPAVDREGYTPWQVCPRVRALEINARSANWDGDVEVDGLVVDLYPLDSTGRPVPARGLVEVHLITERVGVVTPKNPLVREARWVKPVGTADFGAGGAMLRLPFRQFHPEFDEGRSPYGAVHVRLSVPGQGVFESTESVVRLRPYSAIRDRYEQTTGRRFFDIERTGRGRR